MRIPHGDDLSPRANGARTRREIRVICGGQGDACVKILDRREAAAQEAILCRGAQIGAQGPREFVKAHPRGVSRRADPRQ